HASWRLHRFGNGSNVTISVPIDVILDAHRIPGEHTMAKTVWRSGRIFQPCECNQRVSYVRRRFHSRGLLRHLSTRIRWVVGENRRPGKHPMAESVLRYRADRI